MRLIDLQKLCESADAPIKQIMYHLTDNPRFKLKKYAPVDNSISIADRSGRNGIYLTPNVERWVSGHGYLRPYVAEFKVDPSVVDDPGIHGRYGGEIFIPSESYGKLALQRVIPIDAYIREEFGAHGWIEDANGKEFDTGKPIEEIRFGGSRNIYPFRGYRYAGKDVRQMSPDEINDLQDQFKKGYRSRQGHRYPKALRRRKATEK